MQYQINRDFLNEQMSLDEYLAQQAEFSKEYLENKKSFEDWKTEFDAKARSSRDHLERVAAMSGGLFIQDYSPAQIERRNISTEVQSPAQVEPRNIPKADLWQTLGYSGGPGAPAWIKNRAPASLSSAKVLNVQTSKIAESSQEAPFAKAEDVRQWVRKSLPEREMLHEAKAEQEVIHTAEVNSIASDLDDKTIRNGMENAGNKEKFYSVQKAIANEASDKLYAARERYIAALDNLENLKTEYIGLEKGFKDARQKAAEANKEVEGIEPFAKKATREIGNFYRNERNGKMPEIEGTSSNASDNALQRQQAFLRRQETLEKAIESQRDPMVRDRLAAQKEMEFNSFHFDSQQKIAGLTGGLGRLKAQEEAGIFNDAANLSATQCALLDKQLQERGIVVDCSQTTRPEVRAISRHETLEARGIDEQVATVKAYVDARLNAEDASNQVTDTKNKMFDTIQQGNKAVEEVNGAKIELDKAKIESREANVKLDLAGIERDKAKIESREANVKLDLAGIERDKAKIESREAKPAEVSESGSVTRNRSLDPMLDAIMRREKQLEQRHERKEAAAQQPAQRQVEKQAEQTR